MRAVTRLTSGTRILYQCSRVAPSNVGTATALPSIMNAHREKPWQHTTRRQLFVEAAEGLEKVMRGVQSGLVDIHTFTHLPWWATFACSTVFVRVALVSTVLQNALSYAK